jgi:protein-S-isoprenylcysteine O-methyltransferase Ste14
MKNKVSNPLPHFSEAASAAKAYLDAQREHLLLNAGIRAKREGRRVGYLAGAAMAAIFAAALFLFWVTFQLHEAGAPSWAIALGCLVLFGALALLLFELSQSAGRTEDGIRTYLNEEDEAA